MTSPDAVGPADPEDRKILTLARAARVRTGASTGACLRDTDGRTYAATSVALPHLSLTALTVALGMAVSSGAAGLEAAALCGPEAAVTEAELAALGDLPGQGVVVWLADEAGTVTGTVDVD